MWSSSLSSSSIIISPSTTFSFSALASLVSSAFSSWLSLFSWRESQDPGQPGSFQTQFVLEVLGLLLPLRHPAPPDVCILFCDVEWYCKLLLEQFFLLLECCYGRLLSFSRLCYFLYSSRIFFLNVLCLHVHYQLGVLLFLLLLSIHLSNGQLWAKVLGPDGHHLPGHLASSLTHGKRCLEQQQSAKNSLCPWQLAEAEAEALSVM